MERTAHAHLYAVATAMTFLKSTILDGDILPPRGAGFDYPDVVETIPEPSVP